jgi:hypothetical protein
VKPSNSLGSKDDGVETTTKNPRSVTSTQQSFRASYRL